MAMQMASLRTDSVSGTIDDYANNMFRYERLNDKWIERCAGYLSHIFGDRIKGRTVIDYAFGRGNWSVAFLRAGAARVVAIDASPSNVERFRLYCGERGLSAIEVLCANVLDEPIDRKGDILWLYGILHHIPDQTAFIGEVLKLVPEKDALVLAYAYNKGSLREWIVKRCRAVVRYENEEAFRRDSLKFTHAGRMRARDDLTAPHIHWRTAASLAKDFAAFGWMPIKQVDDFRIVDMKMSGAEFAPIHLLFSKEAATPATLHEPPRPHAEDIAILDAMWHAILNLLDAPGRRDLAITAFNTHFSHLGAGGEPEQSLLQLYLLLLYVLRIQNGEAGMLSGLAAEALALGNAALADEPRTLLSGAPEAFLARYLIDHTLRI